MFRVDHVLGLETLHNLLGARLANRTLSAVWNSEHIEEVQVVWDETLALEGRAGYYDATGALEDVIQNHLLQIMAVVAMEPPASMSDPDLRDAKAALLRAVRPMDVTTAAEASRRARYTAGAITAPGGATREVRSYVDEPGVDPARSTETFAEVRLTIDTPRWKGTSFLLRTGKAVARRRKGVIIRFRPVPALPFDVVEPPPPNELRIGLDGPETFTLHLTGTAPGPPTRAFFPCRWRWTSPRASFRRTGTSSWTSSKVSRFGRSVATRRSSAGPSSPRCSRRGPRIGCRSRSTPRAATDRRDATSVGLDPASVTHASERQLRYSAEGEDPTMRLLIATGVVVPDSKVPAAVAEIIRSATHILVMSPGLVGPLHWLTGDVDHAVTRSGGPTCHGCGAAERLDLRVG